MMTVAMYAADRVLFAMLGLDPFVVALPVAAAFFVFGYVLARWGSSTRSSPGRSNSQFHVAGGGGDRHGELAAHGVRPRRAQCPGRLPARLLRDRQDPVDKARLYAAGAAVLTATGLFLFFRYSLTGKAIRACADNYLGAKVVGLNVKKYYALTFGSAASCVAIAGCVMVLLVDVTPPLGPAYTLLAFVIVIVGGLARCRARCSAAC